MAHRKITVSFILILILCLGINAWAEEEEKISEKFIADIDFSTWVMDSLKVSPDNRHIVFMIKEGNKQLVVLDGKKGNAYDEVYVESLTFSPDSNKLAYVAREKDNQFIVVNGNEQKKYKEILKRSFVFSPNSKRLGYIVKEGDIYFAVIDKKEGAKYDIVQERSISFSPEGKHLAYAAGNYKEAKGFVVVDGKELQGYMDIVSIGGGRIVFDSSNNIHFLALKNNKFYLIEQELE